MNNPFKFNFKGKFKPPSMPQLNIADKAKFLLGLVGSLIIQFACAAAFVSMASRLIDSKAAILATIIFFPAAYVGLLLAYVVTEMLSLSTSITPVSPFLLRKALSSRLSAALTFLALAGVFTFVDCTAGKACAPSTSFFSGAAFGVIYVMLIVTAHWLIQKKSGASAGDSNSTEI